MARIQDPIPNIPRRIVQAVIAKYPAKYVEGKYWEYDGVCWIPLRGGNIMRWFTARLEHMYVGRKTEDGWKKVDTSGRKFGDDLAAYIRRSPELEQEDFFELGPRGLTLRNGFLKLNDDGTTELLEHAPHHASRYYIDVDYDPAATCPYTLGILDSYFKFDKEDDRWGKQQSILEFLALCLFGQANVDNRGQLLCVIGEAKCGKTTLMQNLVKAAFGDSRGSGNGLVRQGGMVSYVDPHEFGKENSRVQMVGAVLNYKDEIESRVIKNAGLFKSILSGAPVSVRNYYQDQTMARLKCGQLFVGNDMPTIADSSGAIHSRLIRISVTHSYREAREHEEPEIIEAKMAAECAGIINKLCTVYREMKARNPSGKPRIHVPKSALAARDTEAAKANTIGKFFDACVEFHMKPTISGRLLYKAWRVWGRMYGEGRRMEISATVLEEALLKKHPEARDKETGLYRIRILLEKGWENEDIT